MKNAVLMENAPTVCGLLVLKTLRGCTGTEHKCQHEAWGQHPHAHCWHPTGLGTAGLGLGKTSHRLHLVAFLSIPKQQQQH